MTQGAAATDALRLVRRIVALPEVAMRRAILAETLVATAPDRAADLLAALLRAGREIADHATAATLIALAGALSDPALVTYAVRQDLYEAAKLAGHDEVARLLLGAAKGPGEPAPPDPERPLRSGLRPLTLGERKSLARARHRETLAPLLGDPDAQVIRVLLENPHLTEADVVRIAARRPARGEVLRVIFASAWLARYAVKRALVLNPWTPGDLAVRLVPTLTRRDLAALAHDSAVPEMTRAQARLLVGMSGGEAEE